MHVGAQRDPDLAQLRALIEDGRRRKEDHLGHRPSYREIARSLVHSSGRYVGKPYSENTVNNWFDPRKASRPSYDSLVALARYFDDDTAPWLEAGGFGPRDERALTAPQERLVRLLHPRPLEEQFALARMFEVVGAALDEATRAKVRLVLDQPADVRRRMEDEFLAAPPLPVPLDMTR